MKRILKYELSIEDEQTILLPDNAELLTVQVQRGVPCLWARVDTAELNVRRKIITHGTGHIVPDTTGRYVGTYQLDSGSLVFHVFDAA